MGTTFTPLRYPGGKSWLAPLLATAIEANGLSQARYAEPFAGGAGAAINLLLAMQVERIAINDLNPAIYALWSSMLDDTESFLRLVWDTKPTVDEWRKQSAILSKSGEHSMLERGFAAFFLNRCNRSGILDARPIGGMSQNGVWRIDARYNREGLISRIERIACHKSRIQVTGMDALEFLELVDDESTFIYLDPPYYEQGRYLYMDAYVHSDHEELARALRKERRCSWALTYDDCPEIRELYDWCRIESLRPWYCAGPKRIGAELLITKPGFRLSTKTKRLRFS